MCSSKGRLAGITTGAANLFRKDSMPQATEQPDIPYMTVAMRSLRLSESSGLFPGPMTPRGIAQLIAIETHVLEGLANLTALHVAVATSTADKVSGNKKRNTRLQRLGYSDVTARLDISPATRGLCSGHSCQLPTSQHCQVQTPSLQVLTVSRVTVSPDQIRE